MAEDNPELRYQQLLAKFTARKLPEFYKKYHRESPSNKSATEDVLQEDGELFPRPLPMEKLLDIPAQIRKRRFFEAISAGDIVEGKVDDKWADTLFIRVDSVYYGPNRWINDLKIKAECNLSEFKTHSGSRRLSDSITDFDIGDHVRGVVTSVDHRVWKLVVSFRRSSLPDHLSHTELGAVDVLRSFDVTDNDDEDEKSYLEYLVSRPSFSNPEATNNLLCHLGIETRRPATFLDSLSNIVPPDESGEKLRERQSTNWSMEMVASGVKLFKENRHDEALKCFDQALQMHSNNVEALVARGALHEKDRDWKEATRRYKEVLELDADHAEARDRIHQIRMIMSQQVLAGKRRASLEATPKAESSNAKLRPEDRPEGRPEDRPESLIKLLRKKVPKKHKKLKKLKKPKSKKKGKKKSRKRRSRTLSESSDSDNDDTDDDDDGSEVTVSASEKPSDSEGEWVEKQVDVSTSSKEGSSRKDAADNKYRDAKNISSKREADMASGKKLDKEKYRPYEVERQLSSDGKRSSSARSHSTGKTTKELASYKSHSEASFSRNSQQADVTGKSTHGRHFSSDESRTLSLLAVIPGLVNISNNSTRGSPKKVKERATHLIQSCKTVEQCAQSVLSDRNVVTPANEESLSLSASQWNKISSLLPVLETLQIATTAVSSEQNTPVSCILPVVTGLKNNFLKVRLNDAMLLQAFKGKVSQAITRRFLFGLKHDSVSAVLSV
eukprot:gene12010-2594_t